MDFDAYSKQQMDYASSSPSSPTKASPSGAFFVPLAKPSQLKIPLLRFTSTLTVTVLPVKLLIDVLEVKVNTESLSVLMEQLGFTKDDAETLIGKLGEVDSITLTNAQGQAQSLDEALDFLDTLDFAPASTIS